MSHKALDEWARSFPEPESSILTACHLRAKTTVTINGRVVASGSVEAMRAASRLLSGRCETRPFPFELAGYWARHGSDSVVVPPFRQEYNLRFVPEPVDTVAPLHNDDEPDQ